MNYSEKFKKIWWIIILTIVSSLLVLRYIGIVKSEFISDSHDIILLVVWFCLVLIPIVSEVNILGIKLKKEIEEVKGKIYELKAELTNNNAFNPTLHIHASKDEHLDEKIKKTVSDSDKSVKESIADIDDDYLFKLRVSIERELRRIFSSHSEFDLNYLSSESVNNFIKMMLAKGLLSERLYGTIVELIAITNLVIRGEDLTRKQLDFVRVFGKEVIDELKKIV